MNDDGWLVGVCGQFDVYCCCMFISYVNMYVHTPVSYARYVYMQVAVRTSGDSIGIKRPAIFADRQYNRIRAVLYVYVHVHTVPKYMCRLMRKLL